MSNSISVTNINKVRKIKKNMYVKIKNHYESKYTNISIDSAKFINTKYLEKLDCLITFFKYIV